MGQPRNTTHAVTVAAGTKARYWDNPDRDPFRDLHIWVTTKGAALATQLKWEVLYGGGWDGEAFNSNHVGGVHKDNDVIAAGSEVAELIYTDASIFPPNLPKALPPPQAPNAGFPIVVEIDNTAGIVPLKAYVVFLSREAADSQI